MSAQGYTPATRDDLLPGAVFVVMDAERIDLKAGSLVRVILDDGDDFPRVIDESGRERWCALDRLAVHTPGVAVTSHAAAAAEIARLRAVINAAADQCDAWAAQSLRGSWSTHQVSANHKLASDLRAAIGVAAPPAQEQFS